MRVAMVHWAFPPIIGGVETHLAMLCPEFIRRGHSVYLLTGSAPGCPERENWQGLVIERTPLMDLNNLTLESICSNAGAIFDRLASFIRNVRPDVVHAHNLHYFSPVHARALQQICRELGLPLILTAHNVWEDDLWQEMNALADGWEAVIAVSHYIRQELIASGYDPTKVTVVYHGTDPQLFHPPAPAELEAIYARYPQFKGRKVIFHPARMSHAKGCDVSIRALSLIREQVPEALLVMAGTRYTVDWGHKQPGEIADLQELIRELDLEEHVYLRQFSWQEMPDIYRAAHICVYPSAFEEPFGLAMLESMASGKPLIVTRSGGMAEIITPARNGFAIPRGDYRALARLCLMLLQKPGLAAWIGQRARQEVLARYTTAIMVGNTLAVYKRVVKGVLKAS
ncbi:MAG: alpha-maltose-phosphate synthase [Clostridia bacterium]|nr:alpha-maltose-phosphate synthase [Clostridia bacterium]